MAIFRETHRTVYHCDSPSGCENELELEATNFEAVVQLYEHSGWIIRDNFDQSSVSHICPACLRAESLTL